jgi:hypothetical protein
MAVDFILHDGEETYHCRVTHYRAPCPLRVTGSGMGDAEPPEQEEFEFCLFTDDKLVEDDAVYTRVHAKALAEFHKFKRHR